MKAENREYYKRITDYYDNCEVSYRDSWDLENSMAIHYGYWDKSTKKLSHALDRMNEVLASKAKIRKYDNVLDAGCGVGGSSVYLAKEIGCKVTGITLSEKQVNSAIKNASKHNVSDRTEFKVTDYSSTDFDSEMFDVVWAIESVCYSIDNPDFVKEAFRLLKPGGRLIVSDGFRTGEKTTPADESKFRRWFDGWAIKDIADIKNFHSHLYSEGFESIKIWDVTNNIFKSSRRLYFIGHLALIYTGLLRLFGRKYGNPDTIDNAEGCKIQYKLLKKKLWSYNHIFAVKP